MPPFNREMLTLARESRGYTQTALAELLGISQAEISKYETGMKTPMDEQIRKIADKLEYPEEFFFLSEIVRSFGSGCVYHRKRQSATESKLRELLALINVRRIQISRLLRSVEPKQTFSFQSLDIDEFNQDARSVARALRSFWKLPPGPIQNVVAVIESASGIILRTDLGTDKVDALSQWLPGVPPIFLVNSRIPTDRLRWTLAHEIGHIVMHAIPNDRMEKQADEFASEFLMPEREIKPMLYNLSLEKLAALKPYWRVSMAALVMRAGDVGAITPRTKKYLLMQMSAKGYRKTEPVSIPPEEPTSLDELIQLHEQRLGYKAEQIGMAMCAGTKDVMTNYMRRSAAAGRLQLVK